VQWCQFTSTSIEKLKAIDFFRTKSQEAEIILFEIYLSENSPYSGIICKYSWSFKPNE
jgi:hypothetical protein